MLPFVRYGRAPARKLRFSQIVKLLSAWLMDWLFTKYTGIQQPLEFASSWLITLPSKIAPENTYIEDGMLAEWVVSVGTLFLVRQCNKAHTLSSLLWVDERSGLANIEFLISSVGGRGWIPSMSGVRVHTWDSTVSVAVCLGLLFMTPHSPLAISFEKRAQIPHDAYA